MDIFTIDFNVPNFVQFEKLEENKKLCFLRVKTGELISINEYGESQISVNALNNNNILDFLFMIELKDFSRDYICIYSLKYKKYLQLNNQFILSIPLTPTSSQPLDYFFFFLKVFFPPFLMFDGNFLFICVKIIRRA